MWDFIQNPGTVTYPWEWSCMVADTVSFNKGMLSSVDSKYYIIHERSCLTTFPNIENSKRVENTTRILTNFLVFGNVVKHIAWVFDISSQSKIKLSRKRRNKSFIKSILKSLVILAMWLALSGSIYSRIALSFALNRISKANERARSILKSRVDFRPNCTPLS